MSNSSNLFLWKLAIPIPIRVNEKLVEIIAEEFCVHWSQGRSFDLIKEDVLREFVRGLAIVGIDCRATDKLNQYLKSTVRRFWKDGNAENKSNLLLSSAWIGRSKVGIDSRVGPGPKVYVRVHLCSRTNAPVSTSSNALIHSCNQVLHYHRHQSNPCRYLIHWMRYTCTHMHTHAHVHTYLDMILHSRRIASRYVSRTRMSNLIFVI